MSDPSSSAAPPPTSVVFAQGVIARLSTWPALRVAVDQNWGGPDSSKKRTWLASVIVDAFEEEEPLPDASYVELTLLQVLEDEFDVTLEDGSAEQVAEDIVRLWDEVQSGKFEFVRNLEEQAEKAKAKKVQVEEVEGDKDDWESESGSESERGQGDEDAPMLVDHSTTAIKPEPEIDEDGFTKVKGRGSNHR